MPARPTAFSPAKVGQAAWTEVPGRSSSPKSNVTWGEVHEESWSPAAPVVGIRPGRSWSPVAVATAATDDGFENRTRALTPDSSGWPEAHQITRPTHLGLAGGMIRDRELREYLSAARPGVGDCPGALHAADSEAGTTDDCDRKSLSSATPRTYAEREKARVLRRYNETKKQFAGVSAVDKYTNALQEIDRTPRDRSQKLSMYTGEKTHNLFHKSQRQDPLTTTTVRVHRPDDGEWRKGRGRAATPRAAAPAVTPPTTRKATQSPLQTDKGSISPMEQQVLAFIAKRAVEDEVRGRESARDVRDTGRSKMRQSGRDSARGKSSGRQQSRPRSGKGRSSSASSGDGYHL